MILRRDELQCFCGEPLTRRHLLRREDLLECGARHGGQRCGLTLYLLAGVRVPVLPEPEVEELDDGHRFVVAHVRPDEIGEMERMQLATIDDVLRYLGLKGRPRLHQN